jgi:FlaA1/EpsC-like NDP-sugar epimerase
MRNRHLLLVDLLLLGPLPFWVLALRMESTAWSPALAQSVWTYATIALVIRISAMYSSGVYRCMWRHASVVELEKLLYAGAVSGYLTFLSGFLILPGLGFTPGRMPLSALVMDAIVAIGFMAGPRLAVRLYGRTFQSPKRGNVRRVLVAGAGALGQAILREERANPSLTLDAVGFVDDDPLKQNQLLGGVPVLGTLADIAALVPKLGAEEVLIAIPSARGHVIRRILQGANAAGVPTRIVPGMEDLISGRVRIQPLRKVEIQDLLRRESVKIDLVAVRALAAGRVVLVTGAGGSIGSELCRQIADLEPRTIVVLDHSENQVFEIDQEIRRRFPDVPLQSVIADIRDAARVRAIFQQYEPSVVFHAAAHKHVPLMEDNLVEAVTNNVLGTRNVVDAALDAGTEHFVLISTDKAVRPTSIMGVTKRIAEQLVQQAAITEKRNFVSVRFGNVLASRGSVIPTFLRQIEDGGPVTVTHPEMRRFFMTIPEAVQLVLQAGALGEGSELFVLDMGEPVKIVDLAKDLIRLSGLEVGTDIEIEYTGVRPGEKLFEEVFFGHEDVRSTQHPKVLRTISTEPGAGFADAVDALIRQVTIRPVDHAAVRDTLRVMVPDFAPEDARTDPRTTPRIGTQIVRAELRRTP